LVGIPLALIFQRVLASFLFPLKFDPFLNAKTGSIATAQLGPSKGSRFGRVISTLGGILVYPLQVLATLLMIRLRVSVLLQMK